MRRQGKKPRPSLRKKLPHFKPITKFALFKKKGGVGWGKELPLAERGHNSHDNFLVYVVDRPTRGEVFLDLLLTNEEEIIKDVNVGGSLGCSDHALVEFVILRDVLLAEMIFSK